MATRRRPLMCALSAVLLVVLAAPARAAATGGGTPATGSGVNDTVAFRHLALPDGTYAVVYRDGLAQIVDPKHGTSKFERVDAVPDVDTGVRRLPPTGQLIADLSHGTPTAYARDDVLVTYRQQVKAPSRLTVNGREARPAYTSDTALNAKLAGLGVDRMTALVSGAGASRLATAQQRAGRLQAPGGIDVTRTYRLHLTGASVADAVRRLRADPAVAYASPDWRVTPAHADARPVPAAQQEAARHQAASLRRAATVKSAAADTPPLPANFDLTSSAQSMLDRPGDDVVPAYSAIARKYGQLPGHGEIITNVSLGQLVSQDAVDDTDNPCHNWAAAFGASTIVSDGQRFLDWPGMPLIPTYTSKPDGTLDPAGQVCGADDPSLAEVGLDFSMMAPLPHDKQRAGRTGDGLTDLLGIAPGAQYRLVEPNVSGPTTADVVGAFVGAATQQPRPSVITASLAFGVDSIGFSSRSLEEDPLLASLFQTITHGMGIVLCFSGGDGLRFGPTNAAVAPSGGSAPTNRVGGQPTNLDDVAMSSMPSLVHDSGAISVGGATPNNVTAAPPFDPRYRALVAQQAFPETRFTGARNYASDYGSRVDIAAPGDNVLAIAHTLGGGPADVQVLDIGGTSASAPQVAAAAAIVLQVAKLTGDQGLATSPALVRQTLVRNGTPVPNAPQSDVINNVGPQLDVGATVTSLLGRVGDRQPPSVPRVAVAQRRATGLDSVLSTATDPSDLLLSHSTTHSWITIAPDWLGLPRTGVAYRASVHGRVLASTPSARLQPADVLAAAGLTLAGTDKRDVTVDYTASIGGRQLASVSVPLSFGPSDGLRSLAAAPLVPPVVRGGSFQVGYDLTDVPAVQDPVLVVSEPGRVDPLTAAFAKPSYAVPLTQTRGTVTVPVSALQGGGMYGIGIQSAPGGNGSSFYSEFAYMRVASASDTRPPAPLLSAGGGSAGHFLEVGYRQPFRLSWDARSVHGADGAILEISAAGPTVFNNANPFNNPNGTVRDANGKDSGSIYYRRLPDSSGAVTLDPAALGLYPTMNHVVRVLATTHGQVVGEAGEVSTVTRDGVRPADGGMVTTGFAVNRNGDDGLLTSNQQTASGDTLGSVEAFDQRTGQITRTLLSSSSAYQTPGPAVGAGPGLYTGDVGLVEEFPPTGAPHYDVLNPAAPQPIAGSWQPPADHQPPGDQPYQQTADNQSTPETAVIAGNIGDPHPLVFSSDIAKNTFGPAHDVADKLSGFTFPIVGGFAEDSATGTAVLGASDFTDPNQPPKLITVDLASGSVGSFPGTGLGATDGLAVDSTRHLAFAGSDTSSTLGVYDLTTGRTAASVTPGGFGYSHPAADAAHGLFLIQELEGPNVMGAQPDNNALSSVLAVDAGGTVVKRVAAFNFFNLWTANMGSYVQYNAKQRSGWTLGASGTEIAPFGY